MTERDGERGDGRDPIDEKAAWAEIVAAYGEEPADPPGVWPLGEPSDRNDAVDRAGETDEAEGKAAPPDISGRPERDTLIKPAGGTDEDTPSNGSAHDYLGGPGQAAGQSQQWSGPGPRDWGPDDEDEGHFVPPDPPPLPETDMTTKMAWLGAAGGPLLLVLTVLFQQDMTWWIATLGVGGFLGGFATLVSRMRDDRDDEWTDPGSGAVV